MDNIALFDMDRSLVDYDEGIINSLNMILCHDEKKNNERKHWSDGKN